MRVYQNRRFHSKGPFRWCNHHSNPEDATLKAPSPSNASKRFSRAKLPEKFTGDEILSSPINPEQVEIQRLFNPDLDFSPFLPILSLLQVFQFFLGCLTLTQTLVLLVFQCP